MPKWISFETQEEFFDLVCSGLPIAHAAGWSGVSLDTAARWWRERGVMGLGLATGARGGCRVRRRCAGPGMIDRVGSVVR